MNLFSYINWRWLKYLSANVERDTPYHHIRRPLRYHLSVGERRESLISLSSTLSNNKIVTDLYLRASLSVIHIPNLNMYISLTHNHPYWNVPQKGKLFFPGINDLDDDDSGCWRGWWSCYVCWLLKNNRLCVLENKSRMITTTHRPGTGNCKFIIIWSVAASSSLVIITSTATTIISRILHKRRGWLSDERITSDWW